MVPSRFSRLDFLFLGLELPGFSAHAVSSSNGKDMNLCRFSDSFHAGFDAVRDLFRDIQDANLCKAQISKPNPMHAMLAVLHLKKTHETRLGGIS
jgi:hypothetical protein